MAYGLNIDLTFTSFIYLVRLSCVVPYAFFFFFFGLIYVFKCSYYYQHRSLENSWHCMAVVVLALVFLLFLELLCAKMSTVTWRSSNSYYWLCSFNSGGFPLIRYLSSFIAIMISPCIIKNSFLNEILQNLLHHALHRCIWTLSFINPISGRTSISSNAQVLVRMT